MKKGRCIFVYLWFAAGILIISGCSITRPTEKPSAVQGVLDLSAWSFSDKGSVPLSGEWVFIWKEFSDPKAISLPTEAAYIDIPGIWNNLEWEGREIGGKGWATLVLKVILPEEAVGRQLGLNIDYMYTAYSLWLNGKEIVRNGTVGTRYQEMSPQYLPKNVSFIPLQREILLITHISNFYHRKGGMPETISLDNYNNIQRAWEKRILYDIVLFSCFFCMGFYHLLLFIFRKEDKAPLLFAMYSLSIALRTLFIGSRLIYFFIPALPWQIGMKVDYLTIFLTFPVFIYFLKSLFSREMLPCVARAIGILGLVFSAVVLFTPPSIFTHLLKYFLVIIIISGFFVFYVLIRAIKFKREGAVILLIGVVLFFATAVNDTLYNNEIIQTAYLTSLGFFMFACAQALLLAFRYAQAFITIENTNRSLWRFVPKEFLDSLGKENILTVNLGDHISKKSTILFSDIRNFTTISEQMSPVENFTFINSILEKTGPVIRKYNGFIDKYIGDAVMAIFLRGAKDAITSGIEMHRALPDINKGFKKKRFPEVKIGIGINTGKSMLGIVGEKKRIDSTVISDTVNVASRLEGLTKIYGARIIVSEQVFKETGHGDFEFRYLGKVSIKGRAEALGIYEVLDADEEQIKEKKLRDRVDFEKAVQFFDKKKWGRAQQLFHELLSKNPDDEPAACFLKKCSDITREKRRKTDAV